MVIKNNIFFIFEQMKIQLLVNISAQSTFLKYVYGVGVGECVCEVSLYQIYAASRDAVTATSAVCLTEVGTATVDSDAGHNVAYGQHYGRRSISDYG